MNKAISGTRAVGWLALVFALAFPRIALTADTNTAALVVGGEVDQPLRLQFADLQAMSRTTVTARERDGKESTFEGVELAEIIQRAKPRLTEKCCSNAANTCVIVRAADNYRAVFSLAEIDPNFNDRKIILADRLDGKPLPESQGPLRLVVPGEKVHTRWVRQVNALEIVRVAAEAKP